MVERSFQEDRRAAPGFLISLLLVASIVGCSQAEQGTEAQPAQDTVSDSDHWAVPANPYLYQDDPLDRGKIHHELAPLTLVPTRGAGWGSKPPPSTRVAFCCLSSSYPLATGRRK